MNFSNNLVIFLLLCLICATKSGKNSTISNSNDLLTTQEPVPEESVEAESNNTKAVTNTVNETTKDSSNETLSISEPPTITGKITTDALLRGFYVFVAIGSIVLLYIGIKTCKLRRHRAVSRYKVISRGEDTESFFPLAGEEDEDEEIFNASNQQTYS